LSINKDTPVRVILTDLPDGKLDICFEGPPNILNLPLSESPTLTIIALLLAKLVDKRNEDERREQEDI